MAVNLELGKWYLRDDGIVVGPCEEGRLTGPARSAFPFRVGGWHYSSSGEWIGLKGSKVLLREQSPVLKGCDELIECIDRYQVGSGDWWSVPFEWAGERVGDRVIQAGVKVDDR